MSELGQFAMFFSFGLLGLGFFFGPLGKALARRVEPRSKDGEATRELETRVADLEANGERMAELEERLDFAERLLAQQRDVERLPEGK